MCGIAGFAGEGSRVDLARMNAAQASRGPDGEGVWSDPTQGVYLGHMRLSVIDPAGGAQPMWTADGAVGVVFNGEIYNHEELRHELAMLGATFVTDHSDTEVLLHGYRIWGDEFVKRLNGMWAFAIYDRPRKRFFASRDRFGKKPLYYTHRPALFAFASELTALAAHSSVRPSISPQAMRKFFAYGYIPAPSSILQGIHKLPGGHNLEHDLGRGSVRIWKYWDFVLEPFEHIPPDAEAKWCEELRTLLARAVKRRLVSDVPIGSFLSGGIDSSAISAFAARELGPGRLNSFSIGFDEPSFDETPSARLAAHAIQSRHRVRMLSIDRARDSIRSVLGRLDEPIGDSSILPTSLLCGFAREHVTVAIGGDGGDELFAGYDPFRAIRWADLYQKVIPKPVHRAIALAVARIPVSHRNMSLDFRLKRTLRGLDHRAALRCPIWMASIAPSDLEACFGDPIDLEDLYSEAIDQWDGCRAPSPVDRTMQFYTKLYLQDDILAKVDRASMMHSLEVRAPFLDVDLVDFVRRVPWQYKLRHGQTKYLLKKALEPILPREILHRPKKGFGVPIGRWFKSQAIGLPATRLPGIDPSFVQASLAAHRNGARDERAFLWNALTLAAFVDRIAPATVGG